MIWGLMDLLMIAFWLWMIFKGLRWVKRKLIGVAVLTILLAPVIAQAETEWVDVPHGVDYCPYGDAVITQKGYPDGEAQEVACILYDRKTESWDTWFENAKGDRLHQSWPVDQYQAWTMDGELVVVNDEVLIRPTGRVVTEAELDVLLTDIFKDVKGAKHAK